MFYRIVWGKEVFGRVKSVERTQVVTMFVTLQMLPLRPERSFFLKLQDPEDWQCEPVLRRDEDDGVVQAFPLRSIDRASVTMAYLRGVFGLMLIAGVFLLFPLIHQLMGEPLPEGGGLVIKLLATALMLGVVGGLLSYIFPRIPERDRRIRSCCGECLGVAADPALIWPEWAEEIIAILKQRPIPPGASPRVRLVRELTCTRARMASAADVHPLEARTDLLLDKLHDLDRQLL